MNRPGWRFAVAILLLAADGVSALAQPYPTSAITLVAPYPPGASTDSVARLLQTPLSAALGQTVIIENKGGAGGVVGSAFVARAEGNGTTLLLTVNAPVVMSPF